MCVAVACTIFCGTSWGKEQHTQQEISFSFEKVLEQAFV